MSAGPNIDPSVWSAQPIKEMSKQDIRALIKICKSIQLFIHPAYWSWENTTVPRLEVTKAWAFEFVTTCPIDSLPGIQVIDWEGEKRMRWFPPGTWTAS